MKKVAEAEGKETTPETLRKDSSKTNPSKWCSIMTTTWPPQPTPTPATVTTRINVLKSEFNVPDE